MESQVVTLILRVAHGVHHHFPKRVVEWGLSTILINWGMILVRDGATIKPDGALAGLLRLASEDIWGIAAISVGVMRLVALIINGSFYKTPLVKYAPYGRLIGSFASCFIWMQVTLALLKYDDVALGLSIYPVFLAWDMFTVFHTARDTIDSGKPREHD